MKKFHKFLKVLIFIEIGVCMIRCFLLYIDFTRHRELYAMFSAPWYTDILVTAVITAIIVVITVILCFIIGHIAKKRSIRSESDT